MSLKNKREVKRNHSILRLMERHGMSITDYEYEEACNQIFFNKAEFIDKISDTVSLWYVTIQGNKIPCIYSRKYNSILTICNNKWLRFLIKKIAKNKEIAKMPKERKMSLDEFFNKYYKGKVI